MHKERQAECSAGRPGRNLTDLLRAVFELCKNEADWLRAHETSVLIRPRVTSSSLRGPPTTGQAGFAGKNQISLAERTIADSVWACLEFPQGWPAQLSLPRH